MIRLSVIIPGYNNPDAYWKRCLDSVIAACGPDDEIICVDDGSKVRPKVAKVGEGGGESKSRVEVEGKGRVRWLYLEKNGGQSAARNRALEVAKGEWVTFVDSDDAIYPDVYTKCFSRLVDNPDTDILLFGVRGIWMRERLTRFDQPEDAWLGMMNAETIRKLYDARLFEYPVNKLYRRSFLDANKIRFPEGICPGEDSIFNLSCAIAGVKWCTVACVGYKYYRMDGTSLSRYLPKRADSLAKKAVCWQAFAERYGDEKGILNDLCELSPSARAHVEWDNMWRRGSPLGLRQRWQWLVANKTHFGGAPAVVLVKKLVLNIIRRYFYFSWVYKLHIKRFYSDFVSFRSEDEL